MEQTARAREALDLLEDRPTARRSTIEEGAAFDDFLDVRMPALFTEWHARRDSLARNRCAAMGTDTEGPTTMSTQLTVPAADSRLHTVDTPGGTPALLFLNGAFGTLQNWDRVIQRLAGKYHAVRFDARARGKSGTSTDYSVRGAVDDIGRVIQATGIPRPILVGWSQGATIAVRYAAQHPKQVAGLVLVDGAYPIAMFDEAGKDKVRAQFRKLGWVMRILAALGRSARMSPAAAADVVIELDAVNGKLGPDLAILECPTVYVVGTGAHSGATEAEMRIMRGAATEAAATNKRVSVFATSPCNHVHILSKGPETVAAAIEHVVRRCS